MTKRWWHRSKSHTALFSALAAISIITLCLIFVYIERALEPKPIPPAPAPVRLSIPKIGIETAIQAVGVDSEGRMGLPTNFTDVAWYEYGPSPGQRGSAVIDGHLDTATSSDAVFANLILLKPKDNIYVLDKAGTEFHFQVLKTEIYVNGYEQVEKIFGPNGKVAMLNLITCDGLWSTTTKNYSERLVVYSTLTDVKSLTKNK